MVEHKRNALVTGGGSGLGRAAALRLAQDGLSVGVGDIDLEAARETVRRIVTGGGAAIALEVNVTQKASVDRMFELFLKEYATIHCFFSAASVYQCGRFLTYSLEDWRKTMSINVDGAILCCQRAVREMLRQGRREEAYSILLSMSDGACQQKGDEAAYCASGWALRGFMRHLAINLGQHNILVNALGHDRSQAPGYQEPASAVSFLFSKEARNITGMTLLDNGGAIMT